MNRPVRMSDVARLADVSTMTVSRVLNNNASVLEETRQRVFKAIEQLGYRRNELARSLRERRSRQIGILVPNLYDPFFAVCAHRVSSVAKKHNYSVSIATTDDDPETEFVEASRMLRRGVEGLVVIPVGGESTSRLLDPELQQLHLVTMDRPITGGDRSIDTLLVQNSEGAQRGTEHLLSLGHRRVACFGLSRNVYTMRMRFDGYAAAMRAAGLPAAIVEVPESIDGTLVQLKQLLAGKTPPTAVFCANNLVARQVLHGLQTMNIHPPKGMALVGFDDFETADLLRPGITVVRQPVESMAQLAGEVLFERLLAPATQPPAQHIVLPVDLVVRGSCGAH